MTIPATTRQTLLPELLWLGDRFVSDHLVEVDADGRIGRVDQYGTEPPADATPMPRRALLPGFVNAHSHAFQRGLRGLGESFPAGMGSFWTWRQAMYGLVQNLEPARFFALTVQAYQEMRLAGITTVGEFHYVHHVDPGARDFGFDELVLAAAREVGIRLVLLQCYYRRGGVGRPLEGGQRRFDGVSPDRFWRSVDDLASRLDPATQSVGVAPHSLRAVDLDELSPLLLEAANRELVCHLHVEEQRREVAEIEDAHGQTPMALLLDRLPSGLAVTAVHCTHTRPDHLAAFVAAGGRPCLCPLTEGNLGDGLPPLRSVPLPGDHMCLGSDSNARISPLEEMRWLEYGQRLRYEGRGLLTDADGRVATTLLAAATGGGAAALGVDAGTIARGRLADFVAIDLDHPSLASTPAESLLEALVFGASDGVIAATAVGGVWQQVP